MSQSSLLGLVSLALGVVLLFFAWQASNSPAEQISEALTGRFSGNTMAYLLAGAAAVVAGSALLYRSRTCG